MSLYIIPLITAVTISAFLSGAIVFVAWRWSSRARIVRRFGGVAIILSFVITLLLSEQLEFTDAIRGIVVGAIFILAVGIYDDIFSLSWRTQIALQLSLVTLVFIIGLRIEYITNPFGGVIHVLQGGMIIFGVALIAVWMIMLINALNWIDGIDGLSGGVAFIAGITIFILSLSPDVYQPPTAIISMTLVGSLVGFLLLNFSPAYIFAGTSGAFFMGFVLSSLAIFAGAKIATTLLILAIPIVDALWVVGERFVSGASIFHGGDRRHLHHKLIKLGWSQWHVVALYYALTSIIAVIALNTRLMGKMFTIIAVFSILFVFVWFVSKLSLRKYG